MNLLPKTVGRNRERMLRAVIRHANRATVEALEALPGRDIAEARRALRVSQATRLFLRTFGGVSLRRGHWNGPEIQIEKRRVRALLAVLAAHAHTTLTRDMAIDILWPDADGDSAVNSLNQTVFQLRRYLDPKYRGGESPEYVLSSSEQVGLSRDLVRTDLDEIRRFADHASNSSWSERQQAANRVIDLVHGEFLADLRYEPWASRLQVRVHTEVRAHLLPVALGSLTSYDADVALRAASALVTIDPFDEAATVALADCLAYSGRKVAARDLLVRFAAHLREELDEAPSADVAGAAAAISSRDQIKS
jgi:DNA-binding SARP family transcriptional activator